MDLKRWLAAGFCAFVCLSAHADILAVCGSSMGHAYYLPRGVVTAKDAGWSEDKISLGSFQLIRSGEQYDIIFTDSTGGTLSAKGDGGRILGFENQSGDTIVTVIYPNLIETYVFWFSIPGELAVTYSQAKHATPVPKHSLLKATCRRPAAR